jgi:RimJ/RimL family protein N-acetyltransferase
MRPSARWVERGVEHDGKLTFRTIEPDDAERLRRFFYRLSPETVYRRFFQLIPHPRDAALQRLSNVDHREREAVVGVDGDEIVGVARYDRVQSTGEYEVAVVVEDAWQRHGIARALLAELTRLARTRGIKTFTGTVLTDNLPVQRLVKSVAPAASFSGWGPERSVVIPLVSSRAD